MLEQKIWKVRDLNLYIKSRLDEDEKLTNLLIQGEVSNFTLAQSGHAYFTLKDESSELSCVMFAENFQELEFKIKDGIFIIAQGNVSVYIQRGRYQLYVESIQLAGEGALFLAFEKLKKKLAAEGLFDERHKKKIPDFPRKVGVVTSESGAVIQDIIKIIERRNPSISLIISPALVQGTDAPPGIIKAIENLEKSDEVDLIILARGGGSIEELFCFNDENLARKIFSASIPIISAIGHETDYTISDFVADLRAPTPSAAAEIAVPHIDEIKRKIFDLKDSLSKKVKDKFKDARYYLQPVIKSLFYFHPKNQIVQKKQYIDDLLQRVLKSFSHEYILKRRRIEGLSKNLEAISPLAVLERGYSLCLDSQTSKIIKTIKAVDIGKLILTRFRDGEAISKITEKRRLEDEQ